MEHEAVDEGDLTMKQHDRPADWGISSSLCDRVTLELWEQGALHWSEVTSRLTV